MEFTNFNLMPPFSADTSSLKKQLLIVRETLELAVQSAVESGDESAFYRNLAQLSQTYYVDFRSLLPVSKDEPLVHGLHLMSLLSANRISDFHTQLEQLQAQHDRAVIESPYVQASVRIEQQLMEGSYSAVMASVQGAQHTQQLPSPLFAKFTTKLEQTVREKIADCTEQAYQQQQIDTQHLKQLLSMQSDQQLAELAQKRHWTISADKKRITLTKSNDDSSDNLGIANKLTIQQTLRYATELERIV